MEGRLEQEKKEAEKVEGEITLEVPNTPDFKYHWRAVYSDGMVINQDDGGKSDTENLKVVKDDQKDLEKFILKKKGIFSRGHTIVVDIKSGIITVDGVKLMPYYEDEPLVRVKFGLEFFRRIYDTWEMVGKTATGKRWLRPTYYVGWHTTWKGKDIKRLVRIDKDESLGIG